MSERPDADKAATTTSTTTGPKPPERPPEKTDHPTTAVKPGTGKPPDEKKKPDRPKGVPDGAYGWVTHPDGFIVGKDVGGNTFIYNPIEDSVAHWDQDNLTWRDPHTGESKPGGWDGGHGGQIELGGTTPGYMSPPSQGPNP